MTYAREKPVFRGEKLWKTPRRTKKNEERQQNNKVIVKMK